MKVALRFIGSPVVRRVIGDLEWSPDNGHVNDAPVELAAELLLGSESPDWELAGTPAPKEKKKLAELMGLAPAELFIVPGYEPGEEEVNG